MQVPADVGRICSSIGSNWKNMNAHEWKNFVLLYSIFCLEGLLPVRELNCFILFVKACHILCKPFISVAEANEAHIFLKAYNNNFSEIYGEQRCKPNMHLALHLRESILDYGPIFSCWTSHLSATTEYWAHITLTAKHLLSL